MITKQEFIDLDDGKGGIKIRNTYDTSIASDLVKQINEYGSGQMGRKSDHCEVTAIIPPEEWLYDFHLIAARSALINEHDKGKYTKYFKAYCKRHPEFVVEHKKKFY